MSDRYLTTYYFHGQDLCIVPRHVREDVKWMKDHGVDGVFVGVHDADLLGGNTNLVCDIINEAGLDIWLIPSRIGGLVAGWGRQTSFFSVKHPEWWGKQADGTPLQMFGPQVSVFHPDVPEAYADVVSEILERFPAKGIVWDELKTLHGEDHCEAAIAKLGHPASQAEKITQTVSCFSQINEHLKAKHPELLISCFLYADMEQSTVEQCAGMALLDEFGCDGKCHYPDEIDVGEGGPKKCLLGGQDARFTQAALSQSCTPFTLLETQLLNAEALDLTLERLPEFLNEKQGHLAYYYYPYGMENPDHYMPKIGELLQAWRG